MRYFVEVAYRGTNYAGFQVQQNANTIQAEVEKAFGIYLKHTVQLTGSSRTDAGVHARQNYFHFDFPSTINERAIYNINALLPTDIVVKALVAVNENHHCRFDAITRTYRYFICSQKDPFLYDRGWYYPYKVDFDLLQLAADLVRAQTDFTSFAKRNSQVHTHNCVITHSYWEQQENLLVYNVEANRFVRGMVRGLVGTMLLVGRGKISINELQNIFQFKDCSKANFATPAHGLFLEKVAYEFIS